MKTEINQDDVKKIADNCMEKFNLLNTILGKEYHYASLPLAIIDAVFSIRVNYSCASNVVKRYCTYYNLPVEKSATAPAHTVSNLIQNIESLGSSEKFANEVLNNTHKTAGKNPILKAEAVYQWAKVLKEFRIETFEDMQKADKQLLEKKLQEIHGQGKEVVRYFFMLCGDENFVKADIWILQFLSSILQRDVKDVEAEPLLKAVAIELRQENSGITPRLLDNIIWQYQRSLGKKNNIY